MTVELRAQTAEEINRRIGHGRYATADEVVTAGLRLLDEQEDALEEVRAKIAEGVAQSNRGDTLDGDAVFKALLAGLPSPADRLP